MEFLSLNIFLRFYFLIRKWTERNFIVILLGRQLALLESRPNRIAPWRIAQGSSNLPGCQQELSGAWFVFIDARLRRQNNKSSIASGMSSFVINECDVNLSTIIICSQLDSLQHPGADLGIKLPCMLQYKHHVDKEVSSPFSTDYFKIINYLYFWQIDHVVLGKGKPGGSWHRMDPNLRTLSLSAWMSLPGLNFDDWEHEYKSYTDDTECNLSHDNSRHTNKTWERQLSEEVKTRALVASVADYYDSYVHLMKLDKYFRNDTVVVNIRQVKESEKFNNSKFDGARWIVQG